MTLIISSLANGAISEGSQYGTVTSPYVLPGAPVFGYLVRIHGDGAQWVVTAPSGYYITNGQTGTTLTGVTGYESAVLQYIGNSIWNVVYANAQDKLPDGCVLYLPFNGANNTTQIYDGSPNKKFFTANGDAKISTTAYKFGGSSAYFDGTGDYFDTPSNTELMFGTVLNWSIAFWMKRAAISRGDVEFIMGTLDTGGGANDSGYFRINATNAIQYTFKEGSTTHPVVATTTIADTNWHYLILSRIGNTLYWFIDGVQDATTLTVTGYTWTTPTTKFSIGKGGEYVPNPAYLYYGYFDDILITKGTNISGTTLPTRPLIGQLVLS